MKEIGVRDLKKGLSEALHRVEAGEPLRVTRRGRPVADIVPTEQRREEERLRSLVAEGRITPATRPRPRRSPRPLNTGRSASAIILAEREEER